MEHDDNLEHGRQSFMQVGPYTLRPQQIDALERVRAAVRELLRAKKPAWVILQAVPGWGKTIASAAMIQSALSMGKKVVFLAHGRQLILQKSDVLSDCEIKHTVLMSQCEEFLNPQYAHSHRGNTLNYDVLVASKDTLEARKETLGNLDADLIISDEIHLNCSRAWLRIYSQCPRAVVIGLSATPAQGNGKALPRFQRVVVSQTYEELLAAEILVPCRVFAPYVVDSKAKKSSNGEYNSKELAADFNYDELVGDIVNSWFEFGERRPTFVYGTTVEHALALKHQFNSRGVSFECVEANTPSGERKDIYEAFANSEITGITNWGILRTGINVPKVSCIQLATKMGLNSFLQTVGRGFRTHGSKSDCKIIDHGGNVQAHGWPQWNREWNVDPDKNVSKEKNGSNETPSGEPACICCPRCAAMRERGPECLSCGYRHQKCGLKLRTKDGRLREMTEATARKIKKTTDNQKVWQKFLAISAHRNFPFKAAAKMFFNETGMYPDQAKVGPIVTGAKVNVKVGTLWPGFIRGRKKA